MIGGKLATVVGLACVASIPACTSARIDAGAPPTTAVHVRVYAAIGASETAGVGTHDPFRDAWPRVLWGSMPDGTVLYDFGVAGSTTAQALREQLPQAVAVKPDVATIWLNVNDLIAGVPAERYGRELERLVHALRDGGNTLVLVANTPELATLPLYRACRSDNGLFTTALGDVVQCSQDIAAQLPKPAKVREAVAAYNREIARVVAAEGATLVDLNALGDVPTTHPAWVSDDGFHPSTDGAAAVARLFSDALAAAGWDGT